MEENEGAKNKDAAREEIEPEKGRSKAKVLFLLAIIFFLLAGLSVYLGWKKIRLADTELKIGFITDWEYGYKKDIGDKLTNQAPVELEKAVKYLNEEYRPEMVISGGDMVESSMSRTETTKIQLNKINEIFSRLDARRGYVMGNHDLRDLTKEEVRKILGIDYNHAYFDLGDWRLVLMDTNFDKKDYSDMGPDYYVDGYVPPSEYTWLSEALATDRPTMIFSHHSPIPNIDNKNLSRRDDVRAFLERFKNVILVVSGHDPTCKLEESNGIYYFIANNLVDNKALGSFATMTFQYNRYSRKAEIEIKHHGAHQEEFKIEKRGGFLESWKNYLVSFF